MVNDKRIITYISVNGLAAICIRKAAVFFFATKSELSLLLLRLYVCRSPR